MENEEQVEEQAEEQAVEEDNFVNVSAYLNRIARIQPYKRAVVYPEGRDENERIAYTHYTYRQLDEDSDVLAHGLESYGIKRGTRTVLMVRPGLDFFSLTFALFKVGAIPVIIDPGMGSHQMAMCFQKTMPEAFIGIPLAHAFRLVKRAGFRTVKKLVTVGKRWFWGGITLADMRSRPWKPYVIQNTQANETAAILFTTGSTGPAKGVVYTHGMFDAQLRRIQSHFGISSNEVDLPTFPLFALFDPALGMTAVIPDMDPTKPARANPESLIEAITDHGVTSMFASPALLERLGRYGREKGVKLPSLKRVVSAGAPVSPANIEQFSEMLMEDVEIHTPYGATEAMPVASLGSHEILSDTRKFSDMGYGMCVGRPLEGIEVRIIKISDDPIPQWSDDLLVEMGDIGEITVSGDLVTLGYWENSEADRLHKIQEGEIVWHRMGDLGWVDKKGRIWFCGRKSQRVRTADGELYTVPCEAIFNNHPAVYRSALVGVGQPPAQKPIICIEPAFPEKSIDKETIKAELLNLAARNEMTRGIKTIIFHKSFPVDIRHNSKIFREKLAEWARQ